jgi:uncharacterized membrane-anchored protein
MLAIALTGVARAQSPATPQSREQELTTALLEGFKAATQGKSDVPLLGQAQLHLPQGYRFIPQPQAGRIMRALGNSDRSSLAGLVMSASDDLEWLVTVDFAKVGYVKDDEAKDWKADALLADLRSGTEEANKDRVARGFPAVEVVGWAEPPSYDTQTHRLVWAATLRDKGKADSPLDVNYNTYALGREGYFTLNLLSAAETLSANKVHSRTLLAALDYNSGKAYTDFNSSTDNIAAYGITALVAGAAAKKLGLFAIIGVFLVKAGKFVVLGLGALAYAFRGLFRRKSPPSA